MSSRIDVDLIVLLVSGPGDSMIRRANSGKIYFDVSLNPN